MTLLHPFHLIKYILKSSSNPLLLIKRILFLIHIYILKTRYGKPSSVIFWGPGLGDYLLFTPSLEFLYKTTGKKNWVITHFPEIYRKNPSTLSLLNDKEGFNLKLLYSLGFNMINPEYTQHIDDDTHKSPSNHIIHEIAKSLKIIEFNKIALTPLVFLKKSEIVKRKILKPRIIIQSESLGGNYPMKNKQWYSERFQELVNLLLPETEIIQLGSLNDFKLKGAIDFRGKTSIRKAMGLIAGSDLFIGLIGFYMHAAKAVNCKSLIIYGGREHPSQSGYPENINIYSAVECAPCWQWNKCDHDRKCMSQISAEQVYQQVLSALKIKVA